MKDTTSKVILLILAFTALLLPILIYICQFGFTLSSNHQRWSEFGSIMSGVYSPIIAFIALVVLIGQAKGQYSIYKHQFDQTLIQQSRKDLNFYIEKLEEYIDKKYDSNLTIRQYLEKYFVKLTYVELEDSKMKELANEFNRKHPKVFNFWSAIYPILIGLDLQKEFPYKHNFTTSLLRITSCITYTTCAAIDNFYFCLSNDLQKGKYFFKLEIHGDGQNITNASS